MAQIPQINNPITSKNYNYSPRQQDQNTEPFDVVKLTGVGAAGVNSDSAAKSRLEMGNRELIPLQVQVAKDPTLAVEMLKDLLNVEVLNQALITGHTELYGSLQNLAKELYVTPEQLVQEIQNQEQQNTMFSGHEFYDVLREVAQTTTDPNTRELIGNLLKSINFAQNKNEILGALRANMKFLSEYYSPNEKLSAKLLQLSQEWGADDADKYFDTLKSETLSILKDVSGSLLNDDKTQMLLPLITHNLSRYNNSPYMCKEYFSLLLTQISSGTIRESLKNSFDRLYSAIFDKKPMQDPSQPAAENVGQEQTAQRGTSGNIRQEQTQRGVPGNLRQEAVQNGVSEFGESVSRGSVETTGRNFPQQNVSEAGDPRNVKQDFDVNEMGGQNPPTRNVSENRVSDTEVSDNNYTTNSSQNQPLSPDLEGKILSFGEGNSEFQQNVKNSGEIFGENDVSQNFTNNISDEEYEEAAYYLDDDGNIVDEDGNIVELDDEGNIIEKLTESIDPERMAELEEEPEPQLEGWHKYLNETMSDKSYMQQLKSTGYNVEHILSSYNRGKISGMNAFEQLTKGLFLDDTDMADAMLADLSKVNTMQELIDNLNGMLRDMPDIPLRERMYGVFVDIIDKMSVKNELPQHGVRPPVSSTLDNLTDFIAKNINNPALKSLDSFNASNLLQSLLNAPGVFTPLAHYILPLEVNDTRAFGELWVDNDENNPNNTPGTQRNYHLFLTFDIDSIGRFELDMYAIGEDVNLSLLYPPRFDKQIGPMKERVTKIIRNSGYQARTFETAPLTKSHNLVDVFPKITNNRKSLNKRV